MPIKKAEEILECAETGDDSNLYIFRALMYFESENRYRLTIENKKLSYTRTREIVLAFELGTIGVDKKKFGLHSLRAGEPQGQPRRSS